ncbi:hypothetical protein TorRG33x02_281700, partial [Trema orientale]
LRLVRLASTPENQREEGEEHHKEQGEAEVEPDITGRATRNDAVSIVVVVVDVGLLAALDLFPGGEAPGVLEGGRESGGGGLAGVVDGRAVVVVVVARRPQRARPVRHLLHVVVRRALDVVQRPPWGPRRRRLVVTRHLRVRLRVHCRRWRRHER